jgi:hypothetical protein
MLRVLESFEFGLRYLPWGEGEAYTSFILVRVSRPICCSFSSIPVRSDGVRYSGGPEPGVRLLRGEGDAHVPRQVCQQHHRERPQEGFPHGKGDHRLFEI